jgi:hypothetical protein
MKSPDLIEKFTGIVEKLIGSGTPVGNFFASMKNRMGIGSPERNATDTYEREKKIVPDCISAIENEIPLKQYNIAVLRTLLKLERAEGRIQVTNKRVILRAAGRSIGGRTTLQHEFAINEIAGIEARKNFKFSFLYLVFAILISSLAFLIITRPGITGIMSPLESQNSRIYSIMSPKHLNEAYLNEKEAISLRMQAEIKTAEATDKFTVAQDREKQATEYLDQYGEDRRINIGTSWRPIWINTTEYKETCTAERIEAEKEEREALVEFGTAQENETMAVKKRASAVKIWAILMTLLGTVVGIGGLIPFFMWYKKFGLKLFILNFSIFGFALASMASGFFLFVWLCILSAIITLICTLIFCFRPNLVISVKNKSGFGEGPVDVRCNDTLNRIMEGLALAVLVIPAVIYLSINAAGSLPEIISGPVTIILPIILLLILLSPIVRLLHNKSNGLDCGFAEVIPTEETEAAIREIGAIISDVQKSVDAAIGKWKN